MVNTSGRRLAALYTAGVIAPVAAVITLLIHLPGGPTVLKAAASLPVGVGVQVTHALAVIAVLVITAQLGGVAAHRLGQPHVVGQATAGLLAGPSLLGHVAPTAAGWLHAGGADQAVDLLAQLGVVLFVFMIGRELADGGHRVGPAAFVLGHTMVAVPLLAGVVTAVLLLPGMRPAHIAVVPYALFIGLAMSATALPVLAHILAERGQLTSPIGALGAASAAVGDAGIWCALAVTLCLADGGSLPATVLRLAGAAGFAAAVWWGLRPLLRHLLPRQRDSRHTGPALLLALVLGSAAATDYLGLHAIFGAFLLGLAVPRTSVLVQRVTVSVDGVTQWLLLPLFFTAIGSRTRLDVITHPHTLMICGTIVGIAVASKLLAAGGTGRALGLSWCDSTALGVMMNCRGLTELVLLTVGLHAGILDDRVYTVFVIMALVTTAVTGPLLSRLGMPRPATTSPAGSAAVRDVAATVAPADASRTPR